ncbi:MAG: signal peptidase I [bacterium]|nr:signal peptidase I [bacterium]
MTDVNNVQIDQPRPSIGRFELLRELFGTILFGIAVFTLVQLAIPQSKVQGHSMDTTLDEGQRLLISRVNYLFGDPQRGDIVVFNSPSPLEENEPALIKRVVGLPGEVVELRDHVVYINGQALDEPYITEECTSYSCENNRWELGPNEYFVMGDNRNNSRDSRVFGPVNRHMMIGEAIFRLWPLQTIGMLQAGHE